jgi:flagellar hook assembly protein FlgD
VSLEIFNIKGQKVRTLVNSHQASGSYQAVWNGRDDAGRQAASGIYFYKLQTPGYTTMKKMLLLK